MKLGPYDLNQIYTGDARELAKAIPDNSIDLIFTDPVYDRIEDYEWLAKTAARVLKPDSACLMWISNPKIREVFRAVGETLGFVMPLNYTVQSKGYLLFSRKIFLWNTVCLWFEKGHSEPLKAMPDSVVAVGTPDNNFKWNKNTGVILKWLEAFTQPGAIVFDPFTGGGTVPAVCKMLGRNYLAFEIDPATAEKARERVLLTQPPLLLPEPQQLELENG